MASLCFYNTGSPVLNSIVFLMFSVENDNWGCHSERLEDKELSVPTTVRFKVNGYFVSPFLPDQVTY